MSFLKAMIKVRQSEGGYIFDPQDPGGETYVGIARKFWPKWYGWWYIDRIKKITGKKIKTNQKFSHSKLNQAVNNFYYKYFWKPLRCEKIKNQIISEHLFDCGINLGKKSAVKFLQECCNKTAVKSQKLIVDGLIGPKTLGKINLKRPEFANFVVEYRIELYFSKCKARPYKYKYIRGWVLRSLKYLKKH